MIASGNSWDNLLEAEFEKEYYRKLSRFLEEERKTKKIYPPADMTFSVFREVELKDIRVVILGQDPYHQKGQAHGMAFSVLPGVRKPPSLLNIMKELKEDLGCDIRESGYLLDWARQGVFLMNTCLTVEEGRPGSHRNMGWETLTDEVIRIIDRDDNPKAFLLWGADARKKKSLIRNERHLILETTHPSPLSAYNGFLGCRHFSKANSFLLEKGRRQIEWCLK